MIDSNIFNVAKSHSDAFKTLSGMTIIPAGRSVMSALVDISYINADEGDENVSVADFIAAETRDSVDGPSDHTNLIGSRIDALIPVVTGHIDYIQNVVMPSVSKFDQAMTAVVSKFENQNATSMFDLRQVVEPAPLADTDFLGFIQNFADGNASVPAVISTLPALTAAELISVMRVSSESVNTSIRGWVAEMGEDWLLSIWRDYFAATTSNASSIAGGFSNLLTMTTFDRLNTSLAVFLISRGLFNEPLENAGMPLQAWATAMDNISRFAGAQVVSGLFTLKGVVNSDMLILSTQKDHRIVNVYAPVYARYLEEGGSADTLIGAALSGKQVSYSRANVLEGEEDFRAVLNNFRGMAQSSLNATALTALRNEAKALFLSETDSLEADESDALRGMGADKASMNKQAFAVIDGSNLERISDTACLARELIAGIRFQHTPAKQFLCDMLEAMEAGCVDAREAAVVASVNYVADAMAHELALVIA